MASGNSSKLQQDLQQFQQDRQTLSTERTQTQSDRQQFNADRHELRARTSPAANLVELAIDSFDPARRDCPVALNVCAIRAEWRTRFGERS